MRRYIGETSYFQMGAADMMIDKFQQAPSFDVNLAQMFELEEGTVLQNSQQVCTLASKCGANAANDLLI